MLDSSGWTGLYRLLAAVGAPKPQVPARVGKGQVSIGWPELKIGLVFPNDHPDETTDWNLIRIPSNALQAVSTLSAVLDRTALEIEISQSEQTAAKTTSSHERELLGAMLKAGLPMPQRDVVFESDDGSFKTYPDFCWPDVKLAVELDGHWWHGVRDLSDSVISRLKEADSQPKGMSTLRDRARHAAAHDAIKRRLLAERGWVLMVVSDTEVNARHLEKVAAQIRTTWDRLMSEAYEQETQQNGRPALRLMVGGAA